MDLLFEQKISKNLDPSMGMAKDEKTLSNISPIENDQHFSDCLQLNLVSDIKISHNKRKLSFLLINYDVNIRKGLEKILEERMQGFSYLFLIHKKKLQ